MAADYIIAVSIRYGLLLLAGAVARVWVLPEEWATGITVNAVIYVLLVIHTAPAAWCARRLGQPWPGWMMLSAACAHAFGAAAAYALSPLTEPRFTGPPSDGGMQFVPLWDLDPPSLLQVGSWIVAYALLSAVWAVLVGWASRAAWGVLPTEPRLLRLRKGITARPEDVPLDVLAD